MHVLGYRLSAGTMIHSVVYRRVSQVNKALLKLVLFGKRAVWGRFVKLVQTMPWAVLELVNYSPLIRTERRIDALFCISWLAVASVVALPISTNDVAVATTVSWGEKSVACKATLAAASAAPEPDVRALPSHGGDNEGAAEPGCMARTMAPNVEQNRIRATRRLR